MLLPDVLEDIARWLTRNDLDTLMLVDAAHSNFVEANLQCKGPLRFIWSADFIGTTLKCKSKDGMREVATVNELCGYLRNGYVQRMCFSDEMREETIAALKSIRDTYVLHYLDVEDSAHQTALALDDVFRCRRLCWWTFHYSDEYSDAVTWAFFNSATVAKSHWIALSELPRCDVQLVADWLHRPMEGHPRSMKLWWDGDYDFDTASLISILKKQFLESTTQTHYDLYAGHAHFDLSGIQTEYLENSNNELLEIEARECGYANDVKIFRLPKSFSERTQIVATTDGPMLWDFASVQELDAYTSRNSLLELLVRSGLIANAMSCKCGRAMHLRQNRPRLTTPDDFKWRCSGECTDEYGRRLIANTLEGSWFAAWRMHRSVEVNQLMTAMFRVAA